jgi:hypothetical protein
LREGGKAAPVACGKTEVPRWKWQHLVLVQSKGSVKAYLNGALEFEAVVAQKTPIEQCFFGGRSDSDSNWEGRLDEVAVFDRALNVDEIGMLALPGSR